MPFVVDTSLVIGAFERREPSAIAALGNTEGPTTRSLFVLGELRSGIANSTDDVRPTRHRTYDNYLAITVQGDEPGIDAVAAAFGVCTHISTTRSIRIGQTDRWILADALARRCTVITVDTTMHQLGKAVADHLGLQAVTVLVEDAQ